MFWQKKKKGCSRSELKEYAGVDKLEGRVLGLAKALEQHVCQHKFKFSWCRCVHSRKSVQLVCNDCGTTKTNLWEELLKKERLAYKTLGLVPDGWEIKIKEKFQRRRLLDDGRVLISNGPREAGQLLGSFDKA